MNRRQLLKLLASILAFPFFPKTLLAKTRHRIVLIYDSKKDCNYERLLRAADPALSARNKDWRKHLTIWDVNSYNGDIVRFMLKYGPNTSYIDWPVLVAVPPTGTDVELWTTEWLQSKYLHGCYPLCNPNGWWSVEGDWNPTIEKVRTHLYKFPVHASGHFKLEWLSLLKFAELQSLHSDHHRELIGEGTVTWDYVNSECPHNG